MNNININNNNSNNNNDNSSSTINNNNNNNNNNSAIINIRTSYDDVDFNNKDPLFFSSGNEYIYDGNDDDDDDNDELDNSFINKKKKKRDDFLIDGFDENSEEMLTGGRRGSPPLFGYHKNGNKIILFVGLVLLTFLLCSVALVLYAGKHPKFINTDTSKVYPTIVISIDSFRAEYLERGLTPNLQKFIDDNSFRAQYTTAQFPSKTFPNHYSIATGLYPESHGIVSNHMYDPISGETFNAGYNFSSYWWWGEPIWVTAKKSNIKTACYFWPGCNIEGSTPDYNKSPFSMSITSSQIFDQTFQWRSGSNKDISIPVLTLAYVHEVDDAGHAFGPNSKQVNDAITQMDSNIGILINQLKQSNLYDQTNIIFLSDHGMIEIPSSKYLYLDEITSDKSISSKFYTPDAISHGYSVPSPMISIFPNDTNYSIDYLYNQLKDKTEYLDIYKKEDIPDRFNFNSKSNSRIPPLLGVANPGYSIIVSRDSLTSQPEQGNHGYDPENGEMHSIFIARGPNIKSSGSKDNSTSTSLKEFKNTEIYNLLAQLIGIQSKNFAPTNGTSLLIDKLYKSSSSSS